VACAKDATAARDTGFGELRPPACHCDRRQTGPWRCTSGSVPHTPLTAAPANHSVTIRRWPEPSAVRPDGSLDSVTTLSGAKRKPRPMLRTNADGDDRCLRNVRRSAHRGFAWPDARLECGQESRLHGGECQTL